MNKKEYILCSAIKRIEKKSVPQVYYQNDIYDIELGYRHSDIFARFQGEVSKKIEDQGFYTSKGRFVDRNEALQIAYNAHQIPPMVYTERGPKGKLFSEDLY